MALRDADSMSLDELRAEVRTRRAQAGVVNCPRCGVLVQAEVHYCGLGYWGWRCPECEQAWIDDAVWQGLSHTHSLAVY